MIERRPIIDPHEWLGWRRENVNGSEMGALFNVSPFMSKYRLRAEKTGQAPAMVETPAMRRGRWCEPAVLKALAEYMSGASIEALSVYLHDPELRIGATPDAVADWRVVECKVTSRPVFDAWQGTPPLAYQLQALTNAMLIEAEGALIAVLVLDTYDAALEIFHVERNANAEARIIEAVAQFWRDIAEGREFEPDYGTDGDLLAKMFPPKEAAEPIDLSSDNLLPEILAEREGLKARIKADDGRVDAINAEIIDKLKGSPIGICTDWKITNKLVHKREYVQKAVSYPMLKVTRIRT